jgi:hypothetical protein
VDCSFVGSMSFIILKGILCKFHFCEKGDQFFNYQKTMKFGSSLLIAIPDRPAGWRHFFAGLFLAKFTIPAYIALNPTTD